MFPFMGSKKNEIKEILPYLPPIHEDTLIVEPFTGGGAFSLYLHNNHKLSIHLNDINKELIGLYKYFKTNKIKKDYLKMNDIFQGFKQRIENARDKKKEFSKFAEEIHNKRFPNGLDGQSNIIYDLIYYKLKQFQTSKTINQSPFLGSNDGLRKPSNKDFSLYLNSMLKYPSRVKITNKPYHHLLELYRNDEDAFIFLDPPYLYQYTEDEDKKIDPLYKNSDFDIDDFEYIHDYMKSCSCYVMMVINNSPFIVNLFKGMIKHKYSKLYQRSKRTVEHIIICNY